MSIPTDRELKELEKEFERLMAYVESGQVPIEAVRAAVLGQAPERGVNVEDVPWGIDCRSAPEVLGASVKGHKARGHKPGLGNLRIARVEEIPLCDAFFRKLGRRAATANLAYFLHARKRLIPWEWWGKCVIMPGTVYEDEEGEFCLGLVCERGTSESDLTEGSVRFRPDMVEIRRVLLNRLYDHLGLYYCTVENSEGVI